MFESIPTQKLTLFGSLLVIGLGTNAFFLLSYPLSMIGQYSLLAMLCWYLAGHLMHSVINKNNLLGQLNRRSVLITGCDHGFGHQTALRMNEIGLHVFAGCLYASSEQAANLKKSARYPERMHVLQLNVIDEQQVDEAFRQIEQTLQQKKIVLHALINNAGVGKSAPVEYGNFETTFGDMLNINLNAPIKMTRAALPLIRKSRQYRPELSGDSRIINICSQAGVFHLSPLAGYSCSKAALIAFTNCLRQEIDQFHIRAISIEPTFFNTPIVSKESGRLNAPLVLESTPAEVLETYPPSFSQLRLQPVESKIVSDKVHLVIDTIVEAAIAYQPEMRYTVAEPLSKMFLVFGSFLPVEVIYILSKMGFQLFSFLSSFDSENSYKVKIHQMHISGITSKSD